MKGTRRQFVLRRLLLGTRNVDGTYTYSFQVQYHRHRENSSALSASGLFRVPVPVDAEKLKWVKILRQSKRTQIKI